MKRRSSSFSASVLGGALFAAVALAACGSKTGLFGPDQGNSTPQSQPEAGIVDARGPDAPPDGPVPCVPGRFDFQAATAQLMFVVDRSGSMNTTLDGQEDPLPGTSRWEVLRNGLAQTLSGFDQQIAMGAKFYPSEKFITQFACVAESSVELEPTLGNASKIIDVFDNTFPHGGTPTADALRIAAEHVSKIRGVARTLVLATDGAPNCNGDHPTSPCICTSNDPNACDNDVSNCLDDTRTISTIRDIADNQKVPVYVIGIGSLESAAFRKVLDDMAVAGGRAKPTAPRYYSATTPAELTSALGSVRDSVGSCTFLTPSAPTDPNAIVVQIDGQSVARDTTRTEGWDWVDQAYGTLALFGDACKKAQGAGGKVAGVVRCN